MGNTMTRARMRTLQDIFREFDERHVGYLDQAQFQALLRKLGLKDFAHYTIQESDKKIDFYNFMNITERMLHDVFESMDEDHDLRLNFDEAIATFLKMDTDIVSEERLVLYLKRIQQKHADIIHSDHYIDAEYLLSQPVWLSCLLEALFSPIHNAVSEVAKKKKTISIQEEPKVKEISTTKGGVVSSFKSTVPRFQQDKRSEPGSSECDNRSVASSKDSSKPSSSFLSKERKFQVQSTTNHIGPGAYDISRDISGSRSYASSFHSNTKRSTSDGLVKTNHHQRSQSPGPGSYETRKSESVTHRRTESFSFSKIPRDTIYSPSTKMFIRQKDDRRSILGSPVLSHQRGQTSQKTQSALPSSPQPQPRTRPASASVLYSTSSPKNEVRDRPKSGGTSPFMSKSNRFGPQPKQQMDFSKILRHAEKQGFAKVLGTDSYTTEDLMKIVYPLGIPSLATKYQSSFVFMTDEDPTSDVSSSQHQHEMNHEQNPQEKWLPHNMAAMYDIGPQSDFLQLSDL